MWEARTPAALGSKALWTVVKVYFLEGSLLDAETKGKVSKARALIVQGLGKRPLKLILPVRDNPFKLWKRLVERYDVIFDATKVQLETHLNLLYYN